jgi:hypothetical protein
VSSLFLQQKKSENDFERLVKEPRWISMNSWMGWFSCLWVSLRREKSRTRKKTTSTHIPPFLSAITDSSFEFMTFFAVSDPTVSRARGCLCQSEPNCNKDNSSRGQNNNRKERHASQRNSLQRTTRSKSHIKVPKDSFCDIGSHAASYSSPLQTELFKAREERDKKWQTRDT